MLDDYTPYALVADDDFLVRMDANEMLQEAGFRVFEAANVEEAISVLQENAESVQLLFTDVQMPPSTATGFDLARRCAAEWPHISILVASGQIAPEDGDMPPGAVFIAKPFSADVVFDHLQYLMPDGKKPTPLKVARR